MSTDTSGGTAATQASPEARLKASREAMRTAMLPPPPGTTAPATAGSSLPSKVGTLLSHPVVSTLREAVRHWWLKHPWRPVIVIGADAASKAMVPLARRHPGRLVGGAMLAGAVLSRLKPWKWILASIAPSLLASILPTLLSRLATRVPLPTLLKVAGLSPAASATLRPGAVAAVPVPARPVVVPAAGATPAARTGS